MIAALSNQLARIDKILARLLLQPRRLGGIRHNRLRWAVINKRVERREPLYLRKRQPRSLHGHVAEKELHRPRLCDLLDLPEILDSTVPIADAAAKGGASEQATG